MAAKLEIATKIQLSFEDVAATLPVTLRLLNQSYLIGGYSGSNDRVELDDRLVAVLKITNGYSAENAEFMCRTTNYLEQAGYKDCCLPIPKKDAGSNYQFVSTKEANGNPAFLITFAEGQQSDRVMRDHKHLTVTVMTGIGSGLARMQLKFLLTQFGLF